MFWNCTAARMVVQDPPGDQRNWAIGCKSPEITNVGDFYNKIESLGIVESQGTFIAAIPSLFQAQLNERLISLSVNEINLPDRKNEISLFPNPATDCITINTGMNVETPLAITIYNAIGQQLKNFQFNQNNTKEYSIADLTAGIYFVHFATTAIKKTIKLIVKK